MRLALSRETDFEEVDPSTICEFRYLIVGHECPFVNLRSGVIYIDWAPHGSNELKSHVICPEFLVSLEQRDDVLDRCVGLNVVCGAEDVTAVAGQLSYTVFHLVSDILGASIGHCLLNRNPAMKADSVTVLFFYSQVVHLGTIRLERIQNIQAGFYKIRQQLCNGPASMVGHFAAELMADTDKPIEALFQKISPRFDGKKRVVLRAEVIAGKEDIDISSGSL